VSAVAYLFLAHLGVGIAFTLLLVSKEAGLKFFRFNAGTAALLLAGALALRPVGSAVVTSASTATLGVALAALTAYWVTAGRVFTRLRRPLAMLATLAGAAAAALHGLSAVSVAGSGVAALSALSSVALLGGACTAMVLGHWYLVIPSMEVRHLQRAVAVHMATLVVRIVVVGLALLLALPELLPGGRTVGGYIRSIDGVFFWQRVLFGLAAPAVLGYLTWETAKIRSTQSATGILYVDFFTVIVGEVLAGYLLLSTGLAV